MKPPNRFRALLIVITAAYFAVACAGPPELPDAVAQSQAKFSQGDSQAWLSEISFYGWDDRGQAAAATLAWIAADALSPDPMKATSAGQAAQAIAQFLVTRKDDLAKISSGWLGLRKRPLAEVNPYLLRAYSSSLTPYQGALVGDGTGVRGFTGFEASDSESLSKLRTVIAVIDTDTDAGADFQIAADTRIKAYLKQYAEGWAKNRRGDARLLAYAGSLAGAVAGGQALSGNGSIEARSARHWTNWANYEMAVALGAHLGDEALPDYLFTAQGTLKSPDDVTPEGLVELSNALQNFIYASGLRGLDQQVRTYFDAAAGQ